MTRYLILQREATNDNAWDVVGEAEGASSAAAIRAHMNGLKEGGDFVAIPRRSWQPVKVQVETALKFS